MAAPKYAVGEHVAFEFLGGGVITGRIEAEPNDVKPWYRILPEGAAAEAWLGVSESEIVGTVPADLTPVAIEEWLAS